LSLMKIIAVENIPFIEEACAELGTVTVVPHRAMDAALVKDADVLLVRSGRKIDRDLLEGSRVKFVATATIGMDHIDQQYLREQGIGFAGAPGCNANSVAEYVVSALLVLALRHNLRLSRMSIGVIGIGNVGSRVVEKTRALGMTVLENDPPLQIATGEDRFVPLDDILQCDFVTFHVPIAREGPFATYRMINESLLSRIKDGAFLFNSSRGGIMDSEAVIKSIDSGKIAGAVIDVWDNEPNIDIELLRRVEIGTPHIAGHSFDGKVNGTRMVYEAMCRHFGIEPSWTPEQVMPLAPVREIVVEPGSASEEERLSRIVNRVYDVRRDDEKLRQIIDMAEAERGAHFDSYRRNYPLRREFQNTIVKLNRGDRISGAVLGIGFEIGWN